MKPFQKANYPQTHKIIVDPEIRFGKPCIRGTRITVGDILNLLSAGYTVNDIPKQYPSVSKSDAIAAIYFAANLSDQPAHIAHAA